MEIARCTEGTQRALAAAASAHAGRRADFFRLVHAHVASKLAAAADATDAHDE